jgi:hypothetical protein
VKTAFIAIYENTFIEIGSTTGKSVKMPYAASEQYGPMIDDVSIICQPFKSAAAPLVSGRQNGLINLPLQFSLQFTFELTSSTTSALWANIVHYTYTNSDSSRPLAIWYKSIKC